MEVKNQDLSNNPASGKEYERTLYLCEEDDVWISVEVPKIEETQTN